MTKEVVDIDRRGERLFHSMIWVMSLIEECLTIWGSSSFMRGDSGREHRVLVNRTSKLSIGNREEMEQRRWGDELNLNDLLDCNQDLENPGLCRSIVG